MEMQVLIHGKLSELVSKYNERLVVETAMDSEGTRTYVLPDAVMNMLLWAIYPEPTDDNPKEDVSRFQRSCSHSNSNKYNRLP